MYSNYLLFRKFNPTFYYQFSDISHISGILLYQASDAVLHQTVVKNNFSVLRIKNAQSIIERFKPII